MRSPRQEAEDRLEIVVQSPNSTDLDRPGPRELSQGPVEDVRCPGLREDLVRRRERHVGDVVPSREGAPEVPGSPGCDLHRQGPAVDEVSDLVEVTLSDRA